MRLSQHKNKTYYESGITRRSYEYIEVHANLVNGNKHPVLETIKNCKELINIVMGDDVGSPPKSFDIKIITESGKTVTVNIPNDHSGATVRIDEQLV